MISYAPWDIRVTLDLFLGGLGIGVFLISVFLSVYDKNRYSRLSAIGAYLAPILTGGGLLLLISELGRPERIITTLYNFNPQSVTSWGGLVQGAFILLSLIYAWLFFKKNITSSLFRTVQWLGVIFSILVGVYHGLMLSSLGRPLWAGGMIMALFLISSILGGTALMIIIKTTGLSFGISSQSRMEVAASSESKEFNLTAILFGLSSLQLILVLSWQVSLYRSGLETLEAVNQMMAQYSGWWIFLVIITGLVIPLLGSLISLIKNKSSEMSKSMALTLSVLVIIGGFTFKYIVMLAGQVKAPIIF